MTGARPDTWMPLYIGDYLADTMHLTRDQHGGYLLLIIAYWRRGAPLPDDDMQLASITRATLAEWKKFLRPVLAAFFQIADGLWRHKRVDAELDRALNNSQNRSKAGARGAAKRWQTDSSAIAEPVANASQNDAPSPSPSPDSSLRSESIPPNGGVAAASLGDCETALGAYNAVAKRCGLPTASKLTEARRRKLAIRLKDHGLDGWREALVKLAANRWMHGENDRGWRADFDFLLRPSSFIRLIEGGYDRDSSASPNGSAEFDGVSERRRPQAPPSPETFGDVG